MPNLRHLTPHSLNAFGGRCVDTGARLAHYEIAATLGKGGPPPLARVFAASFGEARRSHDRIWP